MNAITVYRWQDSDGRGPYRPGMSHYWSDEDHGERNPPFFEEFGLDIVKQAKPDECMGCAFRTPAQMLEWFNQSERERLRLMGYVFVSMEVDRVIAESERQLVFARRKPLRIGVAEVESTA